jgi:hypothetical protein
MQNSKTTILGGIVAVILLISGIAWASGSDESSSDTLPTNGSVAVEDSSSGSIDDNGSSTSLADGSTSTSVDDSTSSTVDDGNSSTSTTIDDNTSSTVDDDNSTTSTTIDDNTSSTIDDDSGAIADGARSYSVDGVAVVTVNVVGGRLELIGVNLQSGWSSTVEKQESNRIRIEFNNGDREAEFEIRLDNGQLRVEAEVKD